jgi:hypothetical protein
MKNPNMKHCLTKLKPC